MLEKNGECLNRENKLRLQDGRVRDMNISSRVISFRGESCVLNVMRDVTEQRKVTAKANQLAAIVASSDDAILGLDLNAVITSWNAGAEKLFGYMAGEMIGQTTAQIVPLDRLEESKALLSQTLQDGSVHNFETVRVRKSGERIDVSVTLSVIKDADGLIVGASKVARDITSRVRAEHEIRRLNTDLEQRVIKRTGELEAANKELESFSYSVSHDLRAPLRTIHGFSRILSKNLAGQLDDEARDNLERICAAAKHMSQLIDDILKLSKVTRTGLNHESVDLSELARTVIQNLQQAEPDRVVEVIIREGLVVQGDAHLLQVLLDNLLGNAWKFTGKCTAPRIELGVTEQEGEPCFFVRDNGAGYDVSFATKLFGAFQRLHGTDEFPGTGIGLATVQRVVNRHGGRVWSVGEVDQGATFYFTLQTWPKQMKVTP